MILDRRLPPAVTLGPRSSKLASSALSSGTNALYRGSRRSSPTRAWWLRPVSSVAPGRRAPSRRGNPALGNSTSADAPEQPVQDVPNQPDSHRPRRTERRFTPWLRLRTVTDCGELPPGGRGRQAVQELQPLAVTWRHPRRRRRRCRWRAGPGCRGPGHTGSWCAGPHVTPLLAHPAMALRHPNWRRW
jgi:hypothetical protein